MGLTWIVGVLIVKVDELIPLAYIYTIMVAFQGLFIFVLFVVLPKQVKEAYIKWWRQRVKESNTLSKYFGEKSSTLLASNSGTSNSGTMVLDSDGEFENWMGDYS